MQTIGAGDIFRSVGGMKLKAVKLFDHLIGGSVAWLLPRRSRAVPDFSRGPLRLLVIRPGGIGDAVFLLPALRALKNAGHHVVVLCECRNAGVFTSQQGLCSQVLRYDAGTEFLQALGQRYDVVVDTEQWHHLSAVAAYAVKSKVCIGFATRPSRARLFDVQVPYDLHAYELDSFARLFQPLGLLSLPALKGAYEVTASDTSWAMTFCAQDHVVLALGGSIALRRFTFEEAKRIIKSLLDKGSQVVLLGGADVLSFSRQLLKDGADPRIVNAVGRISFSQSVAIIKTARRFYGHDSGLLHAAVAVGTPVVAVFGPGNKAKWGPRGSADIVIDAGVPCSPCTRFGYTLPVCGKSFLCVKEIPWEKVCDL